jgi:GMP synthase PP-ATPase subunit
LAEQVYFVVNTEELLMRHPFPGPGMAVRIEGEVTEEKLKVARQIDEIYILSLRKLVSIIQFGRLVPSLRKVSQLSQRETTQVRG